VSPGRERSVSAASEYKLFSPASSDLLGRLGLLVNRKYGGHQKLDENVNAVVEKIKTLIENDSVRR